MKHGIRTGPDYALVGAELANSSAEEQIEFFKSFVKECLSWGTWHQAEMQLAAINDGLTEKEIELLGMIAFTEEK